jgi:hypothetical protein
MTLDHCYQGDCRAVMRDLIAAGVRASGRVCSMTIVLVVEEVRVIGSVELAGLKHLLQIGNSLISLFLDRGTAFRSPDSIAHPDISAELSCNGGNLDGSAGAQFVFEFLVKKSFHGRHIGADKQTLSYIV